MHILKYVKRKMDMLFVRGDGVILVSARAVIQCADVDCGFTGLAAIKNIASYLCTSKLTAASVILHEQRASPRNSLDGNH